MTKKTPCPECGADVPEDSAEGLCRRCLLAAVMRDATMTSGLRVRCPHCSNPVEIVGESNVTDVTCPSCHSTFGLISHAAAEAEKPRQLGRFTIEESIGTGSFGTVYKARDPELDRTVAIKIPRQQQDAKLFLKEARSAAKLDHPHVVTVHEVGHDGETFFIVADLVDGNDLATWLTMNKPTIDDAVRFCQQVAEALEHAHLAGVIHRDLKPANILLAPVEGTGNGQMRLNDFVPKVSDFGLAKHDAGEITMTVPGKILGTPTYMSPEQAMGDGFQADARSDIYSLGVILFELITGEKPFRGSLQMLLKQVRNEDPPHPRKLNNRIPPDLETITLRCLDKRPSSRYQSARELHDELQRLLDHKPIHARPVSAMERTWRWCRRNPWVAGLSITATTLLLCLAGVSTFGYVSQAQQSAMLQQNQYGAELNAAFASLERFVEGKSFKHTLRRWHPRITGRDLRGWEWYLLNSYLHRDIAVLKGHQGTAEDVDWSRDGRLMTSVGDDGSIIIWDGIQLVQRRTIVKAHDGHIWCVSWHPLEAKFATGGADGFVRIWNADGDELARLPHENTVRHLVWRSTDGVLITGDDDCHVSFWSVSDRRKLKSIMAREPKLRANGVLGLDWSEKHGLVSCADNSEANVFRVWGPGETTFQSVNLAQDDKHCVAWMPRGDVVACSGKARTVFIWNKVTSEVEHSFDCRHFVFDATWHQINPWLAVCGHDSTVRVWDRDTKRERVFVGHASPVLGVAWRPGTNQLASAGHDGTIRIWSMDTPEFVHEYPAESFCWSPDGKELGCIVEREVHILNMATSEVRIFEDRLFEKRGQRNIAWSPDGRFIATSYHPPESDGKSMLLIWDAATGKQLRTLSNPAAGWTSALQWHPDGSKLLYHGGKTRILDATTGEVLIETAGIAGAMSQWSPNGKRVLSIVSRDGSPGPAGDVSIWDSETGREQLRINQSPAFTANWDPSGQLIVGACADGTARIWDSNTGELVRSLRGHAGCVTVTAWSPDGTRLATAGDLGLIKIWNPRTGREIVTLDSNIRDIMAGLGWSPDGKKLVARGYFVRSSIRIWDASEGYIEADTPLTYDPEKESAVLRLF